MNYWESKDRTERRLLFSSAQFLQCIDAMTGEPISSFGDNGRRRSARRPRSRSDEDQRAVEHAGHVFEDLIILGSATNQAYNSAPGDIRAFNVRTGKLAWTFHTVPRPGEFGYDTWPPDAWKTVGGANNWGEMSIDAPRGIVYVPTGSPKFNFYGANRDRPEPVRRLHHCARRTHGQAALALPDGASRRLGLRQHDGAEAPDDPPQRTERGRRRPAWQDGLAVRVQPRHRRADLAHRRAPRAADDAGSAGEKAWPTQPFPTAPPPFARQSFTEKDLSPYIDDPAEKAQLSRRHPQRAQRRDVHAAEHRALHDADARQQRRIELRQRRRRSRARDGLRRLEGLAVAAQAVRCRRTRCRSTTGRCRTRAVSGSWSRRRA